LDSPEHVDSENIKLKIGVRPPFTNFFQNVIVIHKMWLKLAKLDRFSNFLGFFHVFQVVKHTQNSFRTITLKNEILQKNRLIPFLVNFATFYEVKITF
jgi:hypothetical protein